MLIIPSSKQGRGKIVVRDIEAAANNHAGYGDSVRNIGNPDVTGDGFDQDYLELLGLCGFFITI